MNAKILQFPRPPLPLKDAPTVVSPDRVAAPMTRCDGLVHVFPPTLGRCQCGEELWIET